MPISKVDYENSTPAERMAELERLRAEHFGYSLENPPRMDRRSVSLKFLTFEEHNEQKHHEWLISHSDANPAQSPYLSPARGTTFH